MQHIHLEVKDNHTNKLLDILNSLQNVTIENIQIDSDKDIQAFINLQESSMTSTWDNEQDKAWDELYSW